MFLEELFQSQYKVIRLRSASPATLKLWDIGLSQFDKFLGRKAQLEDFNDCTVSRFAEWRRQHVSPSSVNRDLASILALWRFACHQNMVSRWPAVSLCKEPKRVPVAWTQEEMSRLMTSIRQLTGNVGCVPSRIWWSALLLTAFDSAERIGAILALDVTDVDGRWIIFRAENRKGQRDDSLCMVSEDTADAIKAMNQSRGLLFKWPYCRAYIWQKLTTILDAAGLPTDRKRKFHAIRKTTATLVESCGGSATKILRHSSPKTTESYLDPRFIKAPQAIDYLPWRPR